MSSGSDVCRQCSDNFIVNIKSDKCNICQLKFHAICASIKDVCVNILVENPNLKWFCNSCIACSSVYSKWIKTFLISCTTTMKISNIDNFMHVLDTLTNTWTILRDIATSSENEDTFYVCNISDIVQNFQMWKEILPRVELFYAVNCNNSLTVLEIMAGLGSGFNCASKSEINQVLMMGISSDRIILANPANPASHIKYAADSEVSLISFDSSNELHKVKRYYPNANLVILIKCGSEDTRCTLGMNFGCNPVTKAPELLTLAHSLNLKVVGVSFYFGSDYNDIRFYNKAIKAARALFDFGCTLGYNFEVLNLGNYPGDSGSTSIRQTAEEINDALDFYFPDSSLRVILEPSRFVINSAYILACKINSIRSMNKMDPTSGDYYSHRMYFISDGVYGSFNSMLYSQQYLEPVPLKERPMSKMFSSSIWGPICDGLDQVIEEVILPEMNIGDWIVFENMGAFTFSMSSSLSGFPAPMVHVVADTSTWNLIKNISPLTEDHFVMRNQTKMCSVDLCQQLQTENY